jgi:hypothetical protein
MTRAQALLVLALLIIGVVLTPAWAETSPAGQAPQARETPVPARSIRITLLGTGVGPPVNLEQYGPATLVEAAGLPLLFDCGRGAT